MSIEPFTIDSEAEARAYLIDLLLEPEFQTMATIEARAAKFVPDPAVRAYFLAEGARMLATIKGRL